MNNETESRLLHDLRECLDTNRALARKTEDCLKQQHVGHAELRDRIEDNAKMIRDLRDRMAPLDDLAAIMHGFAATSRTLEQARGLRKWLLGGLLLLVVWLADAQGTLNAMWDLIRGSHH